MVLVVQPLGRFGNNVIQLIHAIHIAETYNINIVRFHKFPQFTTNEVRLNRITNRANKDHPLRKIRVQGHFFYEYKNLADFAGLQPSSQANNNRIALEYIRPILRLSSDLPFQPDFDNTLFIHIRSGDLFRGGGSHGAYAQPPLDYYTRILSLEKEKTVVVLYEDTGNPVVQALQVAFPHIQLYSLPLYETIYVFVHAKYVVSGVGSFIPMILSMNGVYTKLYLPDLNNTGLTNTDKCTYIRVPNYITVWQNTAEQRNLMLSYVGATE